MQMLQQKETTEFGTKRYIDGKKGSFTEILKETIAYYQEQAKHCNN